MSSVASSTAEPADRTGPITSVFGRVTLVSGPESLLADRAVAETVGTAAAESPEAERHDVEANSLDLGGLAEISGGSLFAARSIVVLRDLQNTPTELVDAVAALASDPGPDLVLVLVHGGGVKGKGLLDKVKKAGARVIDCQAPKPSEVETFVQTEARRCGGRLQPGAATALIDAVGRDLRTLAAAVTQLVADAEGAAIDADLVGRYFGGRAEMSSFKVVDAVLLGRTDDALEKLRWAEQTGVAPVLVTSALAGGLRGLGRFMALPPGFGRDADIGREIGVPYWKVRDLRTQARGWNEGSLARAITVAARADAAVKGASDDAAHALERAVLEISVLRAAR